MITECNKMSITALNSVTMLIQYLTHVSVPTLYQCVKTSSYFSFNGAKIPSAPAHSLFKEIVYQAQLFAELNWIPDVTLLSLAQ